jgi:chromosome segregation ATPase
MATIDQLDDRTRYLESEIEGEKLVTRHVLRQVSLNADDLGTYKTDLVALKTEVRHMTEHMVVANAALTTHGMRLEMLTRDVGLLRLDVTALRRGQEELHVRLDRHEERLDSLQAGQGALQVGQDALRAGLDGLQSRQDGLKAGQDALQAGQESLRAEMNAKLNLLERSVAAIAAAFDALEKTVTAIAAAVIPRGPAPST